MAASVFRRPPLRRQRGAYAMMFAVMVIPIIALCGMAIDLGMIYARKADMESAARAIALSAAGKLDGSAAGVSAALAAAENTAAALKYQNNGRYFSWSADAIQFSTSPQGAGGWSSAAWAAGSAANVFYVKVDTRQLTIGGDVKTAFVGILSHAFANVAVESQVVAGRTSIDITPLAICAMTNDAGASRANPNSLVELVEYGFRRGVSYDLMRLNPSGTTATNFLIDPIAGPGATGVSTGLTADAASPFVCRGRLGYPNLKGGAIAVAKPFPLASLFRQLNSRFGQYNGNVCTPNGAPPDTNVKTYDAAGLVWQTITPLQQTALESTSEGKLQTVADVLPATAPAAQYGPLWAHAKAVPYSAYQAKPIEPAGGYATFIVSNWSSLYNKQTPKTYPASLTPYRVSTVGANYEKPNPDYGPGERNRRILHVPLLDCSTTPTSAASVLAVGRFFMTVPATDTVLAAEFGGAYQVEQVAGNVGIFP